PDYRCGGKNPVAAVAEPREPPSKYLLHALGDAEVRDRRGRLALAAVANGTLLAQMLEQLLDEERVATRFRIDRFVKLGRRGAKRGDELRDLARVEPAEHYPLEQCFATEVGDRLSEWVASRKLALPVATEDQEARWLSRPDQMGEQQERR